MTKARIEFKGYIDTEFVAVDYTLADIKREILKPEFPEKTLDEIDEWFREHGAEEVRQAISSRLRTYIFIKEAVTTIETEVVRAADKPRGVIEQ